MPVSAPPAPKRMLMELNIHKASGADGREVSDLEIIAREPITRDRSSVALRQEGQILACALVGHLPGGTIDHLLAFLLQQCASQLHVACPAPKTESGDLQLT